MFRWIANLFARRIKPLQPLQATDVDRALVADAMVRSGVPFPDARVADRIAIAARTVISTVDEQADALEIVAGKPRVSQEARAAMDVELDRVRDALRDELVDAGAGLSAAPALGYEIMRRLRVHDDRGGS